MEGRREDLTLPLRLDLEDLLDLVDLVSESVDLASVPSSFVEFLLTNLILAPALGTLFSRGGESLTENEVRRESLRLGVEW
jgi:hypothetical protein